MSGQRSDRDLPPFSWRESSADEDVIHIVRLTVKGLAGLMVERANCRDITGDTRGAPPAPHEMHAMVSVVQNSQVHGTTSSSKALKLSPTEDVYNSSSSVNSERSQALKRYVAVWADGDGASVVFEVKLPKQNVNESAVSLNSLEKNCELIICLAGEAREDFSIPIGEADLSLIAGQVNEKVSLDVPVYAIPSSKRGYLLAFQGLGASQGEEGCSAATSMVSSTYSIDKSGDSVLRVEIEVEQKESNFEVNWKQSSTTGVSLKPPPSPKPCRLAKEEIAPTESTSGKPVVKVLDPTRVPTESVSGDLPRNMSSIESILEPSIERVLSALEEQNHIAKKEEKDESSEISLTEHEVETPVKCEHGGSTEIYKCANVQDDVGSSAMNLQGQQDGFPPESKSIGQLVQELRSHANAPVSPKSQASSAASFPPRRQAEYASAPIVFDEEGSLGYADQSVVTEDQSTVSYDQAKPRTKLFGVFDIPVCGKLQDVMEEHLGFDDDSFLEEYEDESTVVTRDSFLKRLTDDSSFRSSNSFVTSAHEAHEDDISHVPRPPDFLDNICGRASLCRPNVDAYNENESIGIDRSQDLHQKARAMFDEGSLGRRRRRWKKLLHEMAHQESDVVDKKDAQLEGDENSSRDSTSFDTFDESRISSRRSGYLGPIIENGETFSAFSADMSSVFSETSASKQTLDTTASPKISFSAGSETVAKRRPCEDQEDGTSALSSPRTARCNLVDYQNVDSIQLPSRPGSAILNHQNASPSVTEKENTSSTTRSVETGGFDECADTFSEEIESSFAAGNSTRSPRSLLDFPFDASTERKGVKNSFMQAITCGSRGPEAQERVHYMTSEEIEAVPSYLEPKGDASVGELTATTYEMKIDVGRYKQRLQKAQQGLSSKILSTRKSAAEFLKLSTKSASPAKAETAAVAGRTESLRTLEGEDCFQNHRPFAFESTTCDATDAAWAKQMAENAVKAAQIAKSNERINSTCFEEDPLAVGFEV